MTENAGHLSQNEIDALLATLGNEGEAEAETPSAQPQPAEREIKPYDFRRPDMFSKEQMRALRMIHENWARRIAISFTSYLRGSVEVTLADINQGMYATLAQQLGVRGLYYVIGLVSLPGHFLLHMSLDLALKIVDRIMGGPGTAINVERDPTDMEIDLLRVLTERLVDDLREAWGGTASIRPRIDDTSVNLLLVPIALPADAVVSVTFEVRVRGVASSMTLGLPYPVLKPIAAQLNPYTWMSAESILPEGADAYHEDLRRQLHAVRLPLSVQLGTTRLTIAELASLRQNDILPLDTPVNAPCPLLVSGKTKYLVRPGRRHRLLAAQIEKVIEEEENEDAHALAESETEAKEPAAKMDVAQAPGQSAPAGSESAELTAEEVTEELVGAASPPGLDGLADR